MRYVQSAILLLLCSAVALAQAPTEPTLPPDKRAPAPSQSEPRPAQPVVPAPSGEQAERMPDRAAAYYHFTLAHLYEELMAIYGRSELAARAIAEYRRAMENDPDSNYLHTALAELYAKTGRIRDAVLEAQQILKREPANLEARKLLGRIYLRSLGDTQGGTQSQQMLRLALEQFEQIVRLEPDSLESRLLLGRLYRLSNELAKAEEQFQTAVRLRPESEEAVTTLAYFYNEQGDSKRAIAALSTVAEEARSGRLYAALGYTYEQQKDHPRAIDAYTRALELEPENLDALRGLAQNLFNANQIEQALERYQAIAEADPRDWQTLLRIAEIQRRLGRFDEALKTLEQARTLMPEETLEVSYNTAVIYHTQGRFEEAAQTLQELLDRTASADGRYGTGEGNNRAIFLERLGSIQRDMGQREKAIATFRQLFDLGDESAVRGYHQLIETYRDAKLWADATAAAREGVARFPEDRNLAMVLAAQLVDQGEVDRGLAQVRALLNNTAQDREVYVALAQINSRLRRWKDAEEAILRAQQMAERPEDRDYAMFVRASIYERQKKYDQAELLFQQLLAADKDNAMVLNYLGYMLADRNVRLNEALGYIRRAVELDPQNGAYLDSLGWVYFRLGDYALAEQYLLRAAERTPNDGTILDHVGDLYAKTGRLRLAVGYWERALAEWEKTIAAEVEPDDVASVQRKLEAARVRLAKQGQ